MSDRAPHSLRPSAYDEATFLYEFTMTHKRVILADDLEPVLATVSELVGAVV